MTFLFVVGRVLSIIGIILIPFSTRSLITLSFNSSSPKTVEKTTSAPAAFKCFATTPAPPT